MSYCDSKAVYLELAKNIRRVLANTKAFILLTSSGDNVICSLCHSDLMNSDVSL